MALGANLKVSGLQKRKLALANKYMKLPKTSAHNVNLKDSIVHKAGAPATDTPADNPDRQGMMCLDVTNSAVYICSSWTNATTFTWAKVTP